VRGARDDRFLIQGMWNWKRRRKGTRLVPRRLRGDANYRLTYGGQSCGQLTGTTLLMIDDHTNRQIRLDSIAETRA